MHEIADSVTASDVFKFSDYGAIIPVLEREMFPSIKECQRRVQVHEYSSFDQFWRYKLNVERGSSSILDDSHLEQTVERLVKNLLLRDEWQLWWTGIGSMEIIEAILRNNRDDYNIIKPINLGDGQINRKSTSDALNRLYVGMKGSEYGITHNNHNKDSPDGNGRYYILGRSKILMFLWGQTPGFDVWLRKGLRRDGLGSSCSWIDENRWTPGQFCDTLKKLDGWITEWEKTNGQSFKSLAKYHRPVGRIVDMIYWRQ